MSMGFQSYFQISEEGTQQGTEAQSWGVDSGLYRSGMYFDSESMAPANEQKFLTEIGRSGVQDRGVKRHRLMGLKAEGGVDLSVYPEGGGDKAGIGLLIKHCFGNVVSVRYYPFLGNRIRSLAFSCAAGEDLKCSIDSVARVSAAHGTAVLSVAYPSMPPFMWKDATFQIGVDEAGAGGTIRYTVEGFSVSIDNSFKEVWTLGTNVLGRVVPNGQRVVTGSYTVPYEGWVRDEYDKWIAGTPSSVNVAFASGVYRLEFRMPNIIYTGNAPSVDSLEENTVEMPFQAMVSTNFDLRVFLVNTDPCIGFCIN